MSLEPQPGVLVVDDHTVTRVGVRSFLESDGRFPVVAEAAAVAEARVVIGRLPETVGYLIVDIQLHDGWGIDVIREARLRHPPLEVVVLTAFPSARTLRRAMAAGARGFVLKEAGSAALLSALTCVQSGELFLDPRLGDAIVAAMLAADRLDQEATDERLLTLLADGLTDKQIGGILGKTRVAITHDINSMLHRMGVGSRAAAVNQAIERGTLA
jgi:two-component system response regulator DevR